MFDLLIAVIAEHSLRRSSKISRPCSCPSPPSPKATLNTSLPPFSRLFICYTLPFLYLSLAAKSFPKVQTKLTRRWVGFDYFQAYFGIHGPLGDRMFDVITRNRNDERLTFEDLVIAKVSCRLFEIVKLCIFCDSFWLSGTDYVHLD